MHGCLKSPLDLNFEILVLVPRLLVLVKADSVEKATVIDGCNSVGTFRRSEALEQTWKAKLYLVLIFGVCVGVFTEVDWFELFLDSVGVVPNLQIGFIACLLADAFA